MKTAELLPHLPALTVDEAKQWVDAALAEAKALRQHDARLYPLTADTAAMETAMHLHVAWRRWADEAELLLRQLPPVACDNAAPWLHDLRLLIGYARGLNQMPPTEILARHQRASRNDAELLTTGEARRELGLASRG